MLSSSSARPAPSPGRAGRGGRPAGASSPRGRRRASAAPPDAVSSAGAKTATKVPDQLPRCRCRYCAAPSREEMWTSCPHACDTGPVAAPDHGQHPGGADPVGGGAGVVKRGEDACDVACSCPESSGFRWNQRWRSSRSARVAARSAVRGASSMKPVLGGIWFPGGETVGLTVGLVLPFRMSARPPRN